jgi:hypothetical protein
MGMPASFQFTPNLTAGNRYLAAATGELSPEEGDPAFKLSTYIDQFPLLDNANTVFRAVHAASAPAVDIGVVTNGVIEALNVLVKNLSWPQQSALRTVPPGQYEVGVAATGPEPLNPLAVFDVESLPGLRAFVVAAARSTRRRARSPSASSSSTPRTTAGPPPRSRPSERASAGTPAGRRLLIAGRQAVPGGARARGSCARSCARRGQLLYGRPPWPTSALISSCPRRTAGPTSSMRSPSPAARSRPRYGRIGDAGQSKTVKYKSPTEGRGRGAEGPRRQAQEGLRGRGHRRTRQALGRRAPHHQRHRGPRHHPRPRALALRDRQLRPRHLRRRRAVLGRQPEGRRLRPRPRRPGQPPLQAPRRRDVPGPRRGVAVLRLQRRQRLRPDPQGPLRRLRDLRGPQHLLDRHPRRLPRRVRRPRRHHRARPRLRPPVAEEVRRRLRLDGPLRRRRRLPRLRRRHLRLRLVRRQAAVVAEAQGLRHVRLAGADHPLRRHHRRRRPRLHQEGQAAAQLQV